MRTRLALKTEFKTSPQLIFTSNLLQVANADIAQLIFRELAQNPALELTNSLETSQKHQQTEGFQPDFQSAWKKGHSHGNTTTRFNQKTDDPIGRLEMQVPAIDQLIDSVRLMVDEQHLGIAIFLLHSLDNHGYLRASQKDLANEIDVEVEAVEHVIQVLHQLGPPGIGARDLQECLLIQCVHLEADGVDCHVVRRMISEAWESFTKHRWQSISRQLKITTQMIDDARQQIFQHFYPYPLLLLKDSMATSDVHHYPDLIVHKKVKKGGLSYEIEIPGTDEFELRISNSFEKALENSKKSDLSAKQQSWTKDSIERARSFIIALSQRWITLRRIGNHLVTCQTDFLERGPLYIKPLTRTAVAEKLNLHESTVGRAIRDKVVQLPNGRLIPLSHFFDTSLAAKEAIRQLLANANAPLSDREIACQLKKGMGFNLARRTVTKYRQQLNILPANQRQSRGVLSGI